MKVAVNKIRTVAAGLDCSCLTFTQQRYTATIMEGDDGDYIWEVSTPVGHIICRDGDMTEEGALAAAADWIADKIGAKGWKFHENG